MAGDEGGARAQVDHRRAKVPKHMRLPKMEDWQFYDARRLVELFALEEAAYLERKLAKALPLHNLNKLQVLSDEDQAEKNALLAAGFGDWSRAHYFNFIKASAKYGRRDYARIAADVGKEEAAVAHYAGLFWERAPIALGAEFENVLKKVEKGERKLGEIERLTKATAKFLGLWDDPLSSLAFRFMGSHGHVYGPDEDRHLLVLTNGHGYGNWARIRSEVRACPAFRFDYFLRGLSAADLGKRCENLMREAAKELAELEKRQGQSDELRRRLLDEAAAVSGSSGSSGVVGGDGGGAGGGCPRSGEGGGGEAQQQQAAVKAAAVAAAAAREAESARLAEQRARLFLDRCKKVEEDRRREKERQGTAAAAAAATAGGGGWGRAPADDAAVHAARAKGTQAAALGAGDDDTSRNEGRFLMRPVTDEQLPTLFAIVHEMKLDSREKIVSEMVKQHPGVSKRQVDAKLTEITVKEKRGSVRAWYLVEPFLSQYLASKEGAAAAAGVGASSVADDAAVVAAAAAVLAAATQHREAGEAAGVPHKKRPPPSPTRAAHSGAAAVGEGKASGAPPAVTGSHSAAAGVAGAVVPEPHPAYSAKALYRKHHLASVKERLGGGASKTVLKAELDSMWEGASADEAAHFEAAAAVDEERFRREKMAFDDAVAQVAEASAKRPRAGGDSPGKRLAGDDGGAGGDASQAGAIPKKNRP